MNMRTIVILLVGVMVLGMAGGVEISQARPLEWHFYDAEWGDGTFVTGRFYYDANNNTISNWRIETFPGRYLNGFRYTPATSEITFFTSSGFDVLTVRARTGDWELRIELLGAMTNSGGAIGISESSSSEVGPTDRHPNHPRTRRYFNTYNSLYRPERDPEIRTPQVLRLPRLPGCFISILAW